MAGENIILGKSFAASADLTAKQYCFGKLATASTATYCGSAEQAYGIIQNDPYTGEIVNLAMIGISNLKLGSGGATLGSKLTPDSAGAGVMVTADDVTYGAVALEAGNEGEYIKVLIEAGNPTISGSADD